ncbi:MAG: hypothetical protein NTX79_07085 [Candidatus Micrarchaeota archaeon]|nr:hypothetical protein [Candidatus Micrarchaeota archaeon]
MNKGIFKFLSRHDKPENRQPLADFAGKPSSAASPLKDNGYYLLSINKPRQAEKEFSTALARVDAELSVCNEGGKKTLLALKGEILIGLGRAQSQRRPGDSQADADATALPTFSEAIDALRESGNLEILAEALVLRSGVQGGKRKAAMGDLYEACKILQPLPGKANQIEGMARAYVEISKEYGEAPIQEKALEILAMLPQDDEWVKDKISEAKGLLGDAIAAKENAAPAAIQLPTSDPAQIIPLLLRMVAKSEIDAHAPKYANGIPVKLEGREDIFTVVLNGPIPKNAIFVPFNAEKEKGSPVPEYLRREHLEFQDRLEDWKNRSFMESIDPKNRRQELLDFPEPKFDVSKPGAASPFLLDGLRLVPQADVLAKTDPKAAAGIYRQALEILSKAKEYGVVAELKRRIEDKIAGCGGKP